MSNTAHRIWINSNLRWAKHAGSRIRASDCRIVYAEIAERLPDFVLPRPATVKCFLENIQACKRHVFNEVPSQRAIESARSPVPPTIGTPTPKEP